MIWSKYNQIYQFIIIVKLSIAVKESVTIKVSLFLKCVLLGTYVTVRVDKYAKVDVKIDVKFDMKQVKFREIYGVE